MQYMNFDKIPLSLNRKTYYYPLLLIAVERCRLGAGFLQLALWSAGLRRKTLHVAVIRCLQQTQYVEFAVTADKVSDLRERILI